MTEAVLAPPSVSEKFKNESEKSLSISSPYYRSKAFTVNKSLNPLVAAALPIFSVVSHCQEINEDQDLLQLHKDFCHEIHAFESQAHHNGYHRQTILAARYALCCLIDETIELNPKLDENNWPSLLNVIDDDNSHEQFYKIVQGCLTDVNAQIDLLELLYLVLSSGYQGQYANSQEGYILRENTINLIYQSIRQLRGEFSKNLYNENDSDALHSRNIFKLPWNWLIAGSLSIAVIIGCVSIYFIDHSAKAFENILLQVQQSSGQITIK